MSQYDFGNLESPLSGTALVNTHLEPFRDAQNTNHSGSSRPSYAVAGMIWIDTTTQPWVLKMFNGTANDITLGRIDPTNFWFEPAGKSIYAGSAGGTANAITLTPTIPWTSYETGKPFECLITATNTSESVTVNVSALGNKNIKAFIGAGKVNVPKGALQNGMVAHMVYDGTDVILLNVRAYNKGADIATASTVNLNAATGDYVRLTGTTTVTVFTLDEGLERTCVANGVFTIDDGTGDSPQGIICPGGANITTAAGDVFVIRGEGSGTTRIVSYTRASGVPLVAGGKVLQIQSTTKTDTYTNGATGYNDITGLSVSITPSSTSSQILVIAVVNGSVNTATDNGGQVQLVRGSTAIAIGDAAGSRTRAGAYLGVLNTNTMAGAVITHIDSPATTSATTYKMQGRPTNGGDFHCNRSNADADSDIQTRTASFIIAIEIEG